MADKKTLLALATGVVLCLSAAAVPSITFAGGGGGGGGNCGCGGGKPPPPPPPKKTPTSVNINKNANNNTNTNTNNNQVGIGITVENNVQNTVQAQSNASAANQTAITNVTSGGGGGGFLSTSGVVSAGSAGGVMPNVVSESTLSTGGQEESYEAERTKFEKVVIEAYCFDDKEVPHPASQVFPDRDIQDSYEGEVYRCIAGTRMQVTIAPFKDHISFEGGRTLDCHKGEALYHLPGPNGGRLECRPQKPARDCNERSLLRRYGAGVKVLTMIMTEKYTAYRREAGGQVTMSFDGGVGGFAY
jgi:hypothetical protein